MNHRGVGGSSCFSADYYPYGQENDYDTSCSPTYKFTGYEYDSETGNYYAYARYYDPQLGRFLSPDPLGGAVGDPQSLNRYAYVVNNPETFVDPWGMACTFVSGPGGVYHLNCSLPPPIDLGDVKEAVFGFLSEATGMNGCAGGWCKPNPPPDAILYMLRMHPVLRERGAGPQTQGPDVVSQTQGSRCSQAAYAKADNALINMMVNNGLDIPKDTAEGAVTGAISGCVASAELGCFEGAFFGGAVGAALGAVKGSLMYIFMSSYDYIQINKELYREIAACRG